MATRPPAQAQRSSDVHRQAGSIFIKRSRDVPRDSEIAERGQDSDPEGAAELSAEQWLIHRAEIVHYVRHLLDGDIHAAEDVAQETAIRLWLHPEVLKSGRSLRPWLRTVARNIVVDRHRRVRARPTEVNLATELDVEGPQATASNVLDGHRAFETIESETVVADMLSCLSPKHRAAVLAVYVQGHHVNDVATMLGIPPGTVKSRCHKAIRQLQQVFRVEAKSPMAA
ncbi:sigma-70 family RNA polymerase sigma factor [Streptomyces xiamenensis]|uniref:sigma-70 family RNA polymerase sigma factor n=1 Tax=Streptomyces xiamenensis TaxID=408015 RepID=UPI00069E1C8E|nr:sigma-70 family RNA polymerase sigma factor [Streptomyces xiamenensis]